MAALQCGDLHQLCRQPLGDSLDHFPRLALNNSLERLQGFQRPVRTDQQVGQLLLLAAELSPPAQAGEQHIQQQCQQRYSNDNAGHLQQPGA
ncbi:hypothetical protein D3C73_724170 [compost metagenome]